MMLLASADLHPTTIMAHLWHNNMASQLPYVCHSDAIEYGMQNALVATVVVTVPHAASNISSTVDELRVCRVTINLLLIIIIIIIIIII